MDAGDGEPGVADCIFSAVAAVSHVSGVASHPSSEGASFNLTQRACDGWFSCSLSKTYFSGTAEGEAGGRRGSPAADDEGTDEDDEENHAAHH